MKSQAGIILHPAAELRNSHNTMPDLAIGHRELHRSQASDMALSPSTTWVPPSNRHDDILTAGDLIAKLCQVR